MECKASHYITYYLYLFIYIILFILLIIHLISSVAFKILPTFQSFFSMTIALKPCRPNIIYALF